MKKLFQLMKILSDGFSLFVDIQLFLVCTVCIIYEPILALTVMFLSGCVYMVLPVRIRHILLRVMYNTRLMQLVRLLCQTLKRNIFVFTILLAFSALTFWVIIDLPTTLSTDMKNTVKYIELMFPGFAFILYALPGYSKKFFILNVKLITLLEGYSAQLPTKFTLVRAYSYYSYSGTGILANEFISDYENTLSYYNQLIPKLEVQTILSIILIWILCTLLMYIITYFKKLYKINTVVDLF